MRCEDIQERFIELLYDERGTPPAGPELRGHIASCPSCRQELEALKATRGALAHWRDEEPLRPVTVPQPVAAAPRHRSSLLFYLRAGALAALVLLAVLAVANAEITWNNAGFSFRTHLLPAQRPAVGDYYTKAETRELLKKVLDDTEGRLMETNYLMIQRMMDAMEQDQYQELRLIRGEAGRTHNKN
jgi:hypothetical protein